MVNFIAFQNRKMIFRKFKIYLILALFVISVISTSCSSTRHHKNPRGYKSNNCNCPMKF